MAGIDRKDTLNAIFSASEFDVLVVGGGATGLGAALEAATRGYRTLLLEARDFAKATSSRSTKLVHGGVRYLQQGNVKLVLEALRERGRMLRNAPHLAHRRGFIVPAYALWEFPFYGIGLTLYDVLAGKEGLGRSSILSKNSVLKELPTIASKGLQGGILYYDGQFDDARYAITLLRTLFDHNGLALNYCPVTGLLKENSAVRGVTAKDSESGESFDVRAKVVINATGIFSDDLRSMDEPASSEILAVSQGSHVVLPREFLPGNSALMIPRTSDGRVLFAIPWHDRVVIGTTDDPVPQPEYEPRAMQDERTFIIDHIARYLGRRPADSEILSMWSGQRPLVKQSDSSSTAAISRDHTVLISKSKLVTVTGGKWTTYRKMGEDVVNQATSLVGLRSSPSKTADLHLHGWLENPSSNGDWQQVYGSDWPELAALKPELLKPLHPRMPFQQAEVIWAVRHEMARTVEDVLARRTRALFLDARASIEAAPLTAKLMADELGQDELWQGQQVAAFDTLATGYCYE
jgi:glycerol-3-phosphate dehydrogenase